MKHLIFDAVKRQHLQIESAKRPGKTQCHVL